MGREPSEGTSVSRHGVTPRRGPRSRVILALGVVGLTSSLVVLCLTLVEPRQETRGDVGSIAPVERRTGVMPAPSELDRTVASSVAEPEPLVLGVTRVAGTVVDEGGAPIAGAMVFARCRSPGAGLRTAITDTQGRFAVADLDNAPARVFARHDDYLAGEAEWLTGDVADLRLVLTRLPEGDEGLYTLSGIVHRRELPAAGRVLVVSEGRHGASKGVQTTVCDERGRFTVGVLPGPYRVRDQASNLLLGQIDVSGDVEFDLVIPCATVTGRLVRPDGLPVSEAAIALHRVDAGEEDLEERDDLPQLATTVTDAGGAFTFPDVTAARAVIDVGRRWFVDRRWSPLHSPVDPSRRVLDVPEAGRLDLGTLAVGTGTRIDVRVIRHRDVPACEVLLLDFGGEVVASQTLGEDRPRYGDVVFEGVPKAKYIVRVKGFSYAEDVDLTEADWGEAMLMVLGSPRMDDEWFRQPLGPDWLEKIDEWTQLDAEQVQRLMDEVIREVEQVQRER